MHFTISTLSKLRIICNNGNVSKYDKLHIWQIAEHYNVDVTESSFLNFISQLSVRECHIITKRHEFDGVMTALLLA